MQLARISLTLSRHSSLSSIAPGRSSRLHLVGNFFLVGQDWHVHVNIPNEFVLASPAESRIPCSSYLTKIKLYIYIYGMINI